MDDIASTMGISKKTLYQHVCDRNELVDLVINSEYNSLVNKLKEAVSQGVDCIDALVRINVVVFRFLRQINPASVVELSKQYPQIHQNAKDKFSALFISLLKDNIYEGKKLKVYQDDIDVDIIVGIHSDRVETLQENNGLYESKQNAPDKIKQMITYYIRGLTTPKGTEMLDKHIVEFDKYIE
jgi:hypothetical protein